MLQCMLRTPVTPPECTRDGLTMQTRPMGLDSDVSHRSGPVPSLYRQVDCVYLSFLCIHPSSCRRRLILAPPSFKL